MTFGVLLLAGGLGKRMNRELPKQYLTIHGKPLLEYSLEIFLKHPLCSEVVLVCASEFRKKYEGLPSVVFADPGKRRQDSVWNGFKKLKSTTDLVMVHDGARPCFNLKLIDKLLKEAKRFKAVVPGLPVRFTVKKMGKDGCIEETLERSTIWEIQTPQLLQRDVMQKGFEVALEKGVEVTDDVSLAELIGEPVKSVYGDPENIKVTLPSDLVCVGELLKNV
jgi:2-C-methyl-D-erythritol 4-phosphate cytidylyltransferase